MPFLVIPEELKKDQQKATDNTQFFCSQRRLHICPKCCLRLKGGSSTSPKNYVRVSLTLRKLVQAENKPKKHVFNRFLVLVLVVQGSFVHP